MDKGYSLENKIAIITGAGSGVGRSIALELSRLKMHLCLLDISKEGMDDTAKKVKEEGSRADSFLCDVSDEKDVSSVFDKIKKIMDVNVRGYFLITKYAEKYFIGMAENSKDKKFYSGSLVYICSNAGVFGSKKNIYGISNAARICMMRQAALEMGDYGVRANAVIILPREQRPRV